MHHILILGAGRSATVLIQQLLNDAMLHDWMIHVADGDENLAASKIKGHERGKHSFLDIQDKQTWLTLINEADLVISMLPPSFHPIIAKECLRVGKHFLNASYLSPEIQQMHTEAAENGLLFLTEMGLDPGVDHMSAMEMMDAIKDKGGKILAFRSHCGGLIAPESDDNSWHYKISWNPQNIITAGKDGARYLDNGQIVEETYARLFQENRLVEIPGLGKYAWYPNRDSLAYQKIYQLPDVQQLIRTTLRHPAFIHIWKELVQFGYTDERSIVNTNTISYKDYFNKILNKNDLINEQLHYIGADQEATIGLGFVSPAGILQEMLVKALCLQPGDKDMIVMLHEIEYQLNGHIKQRSASLVVKGIDEHHTAMAKTVGLPLAIAAKLILTRKIKHKGVHIPVDKKIYEPVLKELQNHGIIFKSNL